MTDIREYLELARESGGYSDIELEILDETLASWERKPDGPTIVVELRDGKPLAGFAAARLEGVTERTFSIQAFCVGPNYIATEAPRSLLAQLETAVRGKAASAILRVETSTAKLAAFGAEALPRAGYSLIGHIPDFYSAGNDYYMYAKHLFGGDAEGR